MTDPRQALEAMGLSMDKVLETDNALKQRSTVRDSRICICGHGISKHDKDTYMCKPSKMDCPCRTPRPIIDVQDTRVFLRRTQGGGELHALARGMAALGALGKTFEWLVELKCDRCKAEAMVAPVPVTATGFATTYATPYNALLCRECREEI
jgi:hypothetical protein